MLVGDHHQKFLIAKKGRTTVAFCGGLDISGRRTPISDVNWGIDWVWHDVHAKLEGLIVKDLEREFVLRWNREKDKARTSQKPGWKATMLPGWKELEELKPTPVNSADKDPSVNRHKLQMLRTVSGRTLKDEPTLKDNRRDDIWQGYFKLIGRAKRFIYLENQYFHEPALADAIVKQLHAQKDLIVIVVVSTGTDDRLDEFSRHYLTLRHAFFERLLKDPGLADKRIGVYTMFYRGGLVHSKLALVDDQVLSMGSANANQRGFFIDSELNVMLDDAGAVRTFRERLWSHNLGLRPAIVKKWKPREFIAKWNVAADKNKGMEATPGEMVGEGIIQFEPLDSKDDRSKIDEMRKFPGLPDILC